MVAVKTGRKKGDGGGFRIALTEMQYERMWELYSAGGKSYTEIAAELGVNKKVVDNYVTKGNKTYPPLQKRLAEQNAKRRAQLMHGHAERTKGYYDKAAGAYDIAIDCAATCVGEMKKMLEAQTDRKELGLMVRIANEAHDLSEKWRGTMRALAAGEDNEDTMKDLDDFAKTGAVSEGLKARMRKMLGENGEKKGVQG